jgi:hypothetical protein
MEQESLLNFVDFLEIIHDMKITNAQKAVYNENEKEE